MLTLAVATVLVADAQLATAALLHPMLMLLTGALSMEVGIKLIANALLNMRAVATCMLNCQTQMALTMLVSGKLTQATGLHVLEAKLHAQHLQTWLAPLKSSNGEEIPGNSGPPAEHAAAVDLADIIK